MCFLFIPPPDAAFSSPPPAVFLWPSLATFFLFSPATFLSLLALFIAHQLLLPEWPVGIFLSLPTYPQCIAFSYKKPPLLASGFLISYSMPASTVHPQSQFITQYVFWPHEVGTSEMKEWFHKKWFMKELFINKWFNETIFRCSCAVIFPIFHVLSVMLILKIPNINNSYYPFSLYNV